MTYKIYAFGDLAFPEQFPMGQNGNRVGSPRVRDTVVEVAGGYFDRQPTHYPAPFQKQSLTLDFVITSTSASGLEAAWEVYTRLVGKQDYLYRERIQYSASGYVQRIPARFVEMAQLQRNGPNWQAVRLVFEMLSPNWELTGNKFITQSNYASNGTYTQTGYTLGTGWGYDAVFNYANSQTSRVNLDITIEASSGVVSHLLFDNGWDTLPQPVAYTLAIGNWLVTPSAGVGYTGWSFGENHNHPYMILLPPNDQIDVTVIEANGGGTRSWNLNFHDKYN